MAVRFEKCLTETDVVSRFALPISLLTVLPRIEQGSHGVNIQVTDGDVFLGILLLHSKGGTVPEAGSSVGGMAQVCQLQRAQSWRQDRSLFRGQRFQRNPIQN
ncbi:unnamed protein product [Prunus armeniaca]